jgi:hypothetical protein
MEGLRLKESEMLKWFDMEFEPMNWDEANKLHKEITSDGWRMPHLSELCNAFNSKTHGFKEVSYWTCTYYDIDNSLRWFVNFSNGLTRYTKKSEKYHVKLCKKV